MLRFCMKFVFLQDVALSQQILRVKVKQPASVMMSPVGRALKTLIGNMDRRAQGTPLSFQMFELFHVTRTSVFATFLLIATLSVLSLELFDR
ncbi:hypothetical protein RvY_14787 [Ramazzottius varieornatus]|uniref:Uncharacterized protein n=1 Tax=Ramazzottius varieornatus TaxID=947166 RepID=A0A1D1VXH8_RAMVA|nr:hypothetical protein RvY_14787 [Ramazzottius varieornatus]